MAGTCVAHSVLEQADMEHDDVFNYELVYLRYLEACEDYFKTPKSITGPWTREAKRHIISSIKAGKFVDSLLFNNLVYDLKAQVFEKYQIVLEDREEKLILVGTAIEVLSYEECFDIFVEVHLKTEHSGFELIFKKMENTFNFEGTCLHFFLQNCNICKKKCLQKMTPAVFNDCISIEILKAPIQDHECRFILFYMDNVTKYMLIRPLIAMDEYEIAIEILKILTDFGPPVEIKTIHAPLINNVLTILQRGGFTYDISIHASDKVIGESYNLMEHIVKRSNRYSNYWSLICRFIQFRYNNDLLPKSTGNIDISIVDTHVPIKPFHQIFLTKRSNNIHSVSKKSVTVKDNHSSKNKLSNLENANETCATNKGSPETDIASETEKRRSIHENMVTDENFVLRQDPRQSLSNVTQIPSLEMVEQTLYNTALGNMDIESDHDIKIEFNPVEAASHSKGNKDNFSVSEVKKINMVEHKKSTPLIVDNIPLKEEPVLIDYLSANDADSDTEASLFPSLDAKFRLSTEHNSVKNACNDENKKQIKERKDAVFCSSCSGKMLTDYICFECKKKTHIFCLSRVIEEFTKMNDPVITFTYCDDCLKSKTQ